jgi:hypothetical protein
MSDRTRRRRGIGHLFAIVVITWCAATPVVSAQTASERALKSAFLYNFPRFTEWPEQALPPGDSLLLCVMNDAAVAGLLEGMAKGRRVEGHPLVVSAVAQDAPAASLSACRVLFLSGLGAAKSTALLETLSGKPILTVGDGEGFARAGGIVGLFIKDGTLQFAVNTTGAQRAGLLLSSRLLSLAKLVKEDKRAGTR